MKFVKNFSIYMIITMILFFILICLSSLIFAYTNIDDRHLQIFSFGCILLSNLIGSLLFTHKMEKKGIFYGIIFGIVFISLIYVISSLMFGSFNITNTFYFDIIICILSGIIGGIIGVNIKC